MLRYNCQLYANGTDLFRMDDPRVATKTHLTNWMGQNSYLFLYLTDINIVNFV